MAGYIKKILERKNNGEWRLTERNNVIVYDYDVRVSNQSPPSSQLLNAAEKVVGTTPGLRGGGGGYSGFEVMRRCEGCFGVRKFWQVCFFYSL